MDRLSRSGPASWWLYSNSDRRPDRPARHGEVAYGKVLRAPHGCSDLTARFCLSRCVGKPVESGQANFSSSMRLSLQRSSRHTVRGRESVDRRRRSSDPPGAGIMRAALAKRAENQSNSAKGRP